MSDADLLRPAFEAIEAAHARLRELERRAATMARPDLSEALLAMLAATEEREAHNRKGTESGLAYEQRSAEWHAEWSAICERDWRSTRHCLDLARAIRSVLAEKAEAAE